MYLLDQVGRRRTAEDRFEHAPERSCDVAWGRLSHGDEIDVFAVPAGAREVHLVQHGAPAHGIER